LVALTNSGIDLSLFAVFGGAIGLGVGFGLQKGIANLFSGMMLLLDKSIKPGDIIELENGTYGHVHQMAARYTEVVTADRRSYLIPNEELITQRVINWSHNDTQILVSVNFGVHYESDPHQVLAVALKAVQKPARVLKTHKPICFMTEFGDSAIKFRLSFWIDDPENGIGNIKGEVLLALWDAFKENAIQIPYPHREVFVHKMD
jgi:small-conductance mechanosensitive channel